MFNLRNNKRAHYLYTAARIMLGAVFLYACWDKLIYPDVFADAIRNYQLVPEPYIRPMALLLPWIELVSGVCLIINRWSRGAALVVSLLMVVFMTALGINMIRGLDVHCGCFTLNQEATPGMWYAMVRDIVLLVMAVGIAGYRYPGSLSQVSVSRAAAHRKG